MPSFIVSSSLPEAHLYASTVLLSVPGCQSLACVFHCSMTIYCEKTELTLVNHMPSNGPRTHLYSLVDFDDRQYGP